MARRELKERAREMRLSGKSVLEIAGLLGVSKSSVSIWVRDIVLEPEQMEFLNERRRQMLIRNNRGARANYDKHKELRERSREVGRIRARERPTPLHMMGCMLYWSDGAKGRSKVFFVNSDPAMIRLFMRFMREEMRVADADFSVYIRCHPQSNGEIQRIENYWLDLLSLPTSSLRKTQIRASGTVRINKLANGICGLMVFNIEIAQQIFGAIQEYAGADQLEWLD